MPPISAVDLFCGAGGLTHGLIKANIDVVAGIDIEESCRFAFEKNNKGAAFINADVSKIDSREIRSLYPHGHIKLLAGCAPCQPFSTYSQGRDASKDERWPLLYSFSRLINDIRPELVTMENVPDVTKHQVYHDFVYKLECLGYNVWAGKVFCPDYGMPQVRKRHVLLASRIGDIQLIEPTHQPDCYVTVKSTIGHLPPISAGECHPNDPLHQSSRLSELNMARIRHSKPGGTWRDWPANLIAKCHTKASGKSYSGVYSRMRWDQPSPTMTTQCYGYGNGRFGHPDQNRAISLREAALLQTFPQNYEFFPDKSELKFKIVGKMIGNAVPVKLGTVIGESFLKSLAA
ncbi:DNA cytosine methyltransferase [Marinobacter halodurans]|uniref:Cytosine-specific methyltransferase n=1 Tax=Marinobacter halodurans TaxID=2528979 RepID=A0ABY1ZIP0_9GAMM|nr:DNA cytosine methyltransferase [Marinobacter halodurans]TBW48520.1 DNA cytosine methyltransferase [Marinobacter halodurans]